MRVRITGVAALAICFSSCASHKLGVPENFSSQATHMEVKGLGSWKGSHPISFGVYRTSKIKRGQHIITTQHDGSFVTTDGRTLKAFPILSGSTASDQRASYRYTIQDDTQKAEVFCIERMERSQLEIRTNIQWLGDFSRLNNYQYAFSAVIAPAGAPEDTHWKVLLSNNFDRRKDTSRRLLDPPYVEEKGYAVNGKDTIRIQAIRVNKATAASGRDGKLPVKIISGYELRIDDGVIAIIDTYGHGVWIYNDLDAATRLVAAAVSSALLLRRVQDIKG